MPTDDYIKREDAIFALCENCRMTEGCGITGDLCDEVKWINQVPSADVAPVRHGRWLKSPECPEEYDICSICGLNDKHRERANHEHPLFESMPPFCKWCGAKMDEEG